jgi:hypothetical protein
MSRAALGATIVAFWVAAPNTAVAAPAPAPALGRLTYVERTVELEGAGAWRAAREGGALRIGERLRTAGDAVLHIDFSWMAASVSASSVLHFPDGHFLEGQLAQGRVALRADRREILKLVTDEAEVRGQGRVVVRRTGQETLVSALAGRFSVDGKPGVVNVPAGSGVVVRAGGAPLKAVLLPAPPDGLVPGQDALYAAPGKPIDLRWNGRAAAYHVEVLAVGSDTVLLERDVTAPALQLAIRWPGAFRWRVASRDASGLEGLPSREGLICVDE